MAGKIVVNRNADRTRGRLLRAAIRLFTQRGYHAAAKTNSPVENASG